MAIKVPKTVVDGLTAVKETGNTNMFDRPRVVELLQELGFDEAARWVEQNKKQYALGIFQGFQGE